MKFEKPAEWNRTYAESAQTCCELEKRIRRESGEKRKWKAPAQRLTFFSRATPHYQGGENSHKS
ncbi:hypothetical protein CWO07_24115 [Vibrio splendidus]|uniref:Uncharacterized protein n=1 Tax=Vibrio splendidus TaxID=29497 RepID=A0A2T5EJC5_VIBSP|nr:hypothetical protein BCU23_09030 [Vibrio splendidus]PTP20339.1 hypothetical protein CWO07_24115 [Vibrio splendidus]